jgi:hypothetical protein
MFVKSCNQLESHFSQKTTDYSFCYEYDQAEIPALSFEKQQQSNNSKSSFLYNSWSKECDLL